MNSEREFNKVLQEFLESSEKLLDAAQLCKDGPIKQDMIAFIQPKFLEMCGRSEGVKLMVEKSFYESRDFILQEMVEITKLNIEISDQIKNKLGKLEI